MKYTSFLFALLSFPTTATLAAAQEPDDEDQILVIVEQFSDGIIEGDSAKLASLYAYPEIPFFATRGGMGPGGFNPGFNTGAAFGGMVKRMASMGSAEEKFMNIVVDAVDGVATMRSDYEFHMNGEFSNGGTEMWTLYKTPDGWKIVSVIWSQ